MFSFAAKILGAIQRTFKLSAPQDEELSKNDFNNIRTYIPEKLITNQELKKNETSTSTTSSSTKTVQPKKHFKICLDSLKKLRKKFRRSSTLLFEKVRPSEEQLAALLKKFNISRASAESDDELYRTEDENLSDSESEFGGWGDESFDNGDFPANDDENVELSHVKVLPLSNFYIIQGGELEENSGLNSAAERLINGKFSEEDFDVSNDLVSIESKEHVQDFEDLIHGTLSFIDLPDVNIGMDTFFNTIINELGL